MSQSYNNGASYGGFPNQQQNQSYPYNQTPQQDYNQAQQPQYVKRFHSFEEHLLIIRTGLNISKEMSNPQRASAVSAERSPAVSQEDSQVIKQAMVSLAP